MLLLGDLALITGQHVLLGIQMQEDINVSGHWHSRKKCVQEICERQVNS